MPDSEAQSNVKRSVFRDPAAIPTLQKIRLILMAHGYNVTEPKPGKACHAFCRAAFADLEIAIVLGVERRNAKIDFEIMTWPSQSFLQRMTRRKMTHPDCQEWVELALAIRTAVTRDLQPERVTLRTFAEEAEPDC